MAVSLVTFDTGQKPSCSSRDVWRQDISGGMSHLSAHSIEAQELQHEEEILRNPYNLKAWWNFLAYKKDSPPITRYVIYERSLKFLPRSYKLWHAYLQERSAALINKCIADKGYSILENTYERALVNMYKMPRIWIEHTALLMKMQKGTAARRAFDRALQALPITQHKKIWEQYIKWARGFGVEETCVRVYRRFLMYDSSHREDFVNYLIDVSEFEEAAKQLVLCVNDDHYISPSGQTKHQMWMQLCDICASNPEAVSNSLKVDSIIRSGISRFSDEVGRLWCRLADYYVRLGQFEKARDIYEEALNSVTTVRDFSIIFDSYVKVEESVLTAKMSMIEDEAEENDDDGVKADIVTDASEVEMRLARLEYLMDKRPLMLSSVVLRQNPHNVHEWHKRAKLFKNDVQRSLMTYIEGVKTVDPKLATGKLSGLWLALARFYENHEDVENARTILSKATEVDYKSVDELANIWCAWGEMELRNEAFDKALQVMQQAVAEPVATLKRRKARAAAQGKGGDADNFEGSVCSDRVYKNVKAWSLFLDLEESLGSVETCRAAYDRAMDLKIVTPQMIMNYAAYLEERDFFEDSFRVYERAVALFTYPQVKKIWLEYLDKFIARYAGGKLERLRDLFEQAVVKVPAEDAAEFYLKYAKAEEMFGLARHAMAVYDRATRLVPEPNRLDMYRLYVKKVEHYFGVTKTRPVYERAVAELNDVHSRALCLEFADMERKLGEIDRARAIMQHGSQFADPRKDPIYWRRWREFEEAHGNEDTFRDMLRVQRSVETANSQSNYLAAEMVAGEALAAAEATGIEAMGQRAEKEAILRAAATGLGAEKQKDDSTSQGMKRKFVAASASAANKAVATEMGRRILEEEIDIDEEETVQLKAVPQAIFGTAVVDSSV